MLRREAPTSEGLPARLHACLTSRSLDDAVGLGLDLSNDPEMWADVLHHLEDERSAHPLAQVRAFLDVLGVGPVNRRPILGETPDAIRRDAAHFQDLAARAKRLYEGN